MASTTQIPATSSSVGPHRVAIIGCGAVVERYHLPASKLVPRLSIEVLVDRDERRAAALAAAYGVPRVSHDYRTIVGDVDAAIIALPHSLNARVAREMLGERISVLVEKPMAVGAAEAQEVLSASEAGGFSPSGVHAEVRLWRGIRTTRAPGKSSRHNYRVLRGRWISV
jgi:NAD-dependent oxidoreductase involved in siderophore biosynthesis